MDHPNIVRIHESYFEDGRIVIIQELCEGGDLVSYITKYKKFNEADAAMIIKTVLGAINYCHKQGVVHRDIKPGNILLEKRPDGKIDFRTLKIVDFGISDKFSRISEIDISGTPPFMSPGMLAGSYSEKCDVWAIGVMAYLLISGRYPFLGDSVEKI